jgi:amino acid transporter
MCLCILLCIIVYALPTIVGVCAGTDGLTDVTKWDDGYWTVIGAHIGGGWLAAWMTFAGAVSSCGLLCTLLCTTSYAMASMGRRGYLPAAVAWARHDGTP